MTELVEVDLTVSVQVDLGDQIVPDLLLFLCDLVALPLEASERFYDLVRANCTTTISIEQAESEAEFVVRN